MQQSTQTSSFNYNSTQCAIFGGLLLGASTSLHLLLKGRVTGMSGIFNGIVFNDIKSRGWKWACLSGMITTSGYLYNQLQDKKYGSNQVQFFEEPQKMVSNLSLVGFSLAGFLVGIGTKLGNGCTSGHGICGMPRFAKRSWAAVATFMTLGVLVSTFRDQIPFGKDFLFKTEGLNLLQDKNQMYKNALYISSFSFLAFLGQMAFTLSKAANPAAAASDLLISFLVGSVFASGLTLSGMLRRSKILGFLTLDKNWDYDLIFVMLSAVTLNIFTFYYIMKMRRKPVWGTGFDVPSADVIDKKLITGAGIFGAGWGLGGLCPGPGMNLLPAFTPHIGVLFLGSVYLGQKTAGWIDNKYFAKK